MLLGSEAAGVVLAVDDGAVGPTGSPRSFPLDQVAAAHRQAEGHTTGKLVLVP
jgi:NADPH:quinone reductase-like Zn-dependent oxidoreductase